MLQGVAAVALIVSCACAAPRLLAEPDSSAQRVTLAPGEQAAVAGDRLQLRFDEVVSDSRCPTTEQCVWAGRAEVALTVTSSGGSSSYRVFAPGASPTAVTHEGQRIELVRLDPHPKTARGVPKDQYRATFAVRPE